VENAWSADSVKRSISDGSRDRVDDGVVPGDCAYAGVIVVILEP